MKVFGKSTFKTAALTVLSLSTVLGAGISAQAAPGANGGPGGRGEHRGGRGGMGLKGLAQKLNLSADQQTRIKSIMSSARSQSQAVRQDSSLTDVQKKERLKAIHKASRDAVMNVLTPAQRAQLRQLRQERRANRGNRSNGERAQRNQGLNG